MVKYPPNETLVHNIDLSFHAICSHISNDLGKFAKRHILSQIEAFETMSVREMDVLMCIAYFDETVISSDVAETIRFDPATVTRAVKYLIESGMVTKIHNSSDSRSMLLVLTDKGQGVAKDYHKKCSEVLAEAKSQITETLTEDEQMQFLSLLMKMRKRSAQYATIRDLEVCEESERNNVYDISMSCSARA